MEDLLVEIIGVLLTAIIGWGAMLLRKKFAIEIEAKHRDALHSALLTAAKNLIDRDYKNPPSEAAIDTVIDYANRSVPDAIQTLNPSFGVIHDLAASKIKEVFRDR